MTDIAQNLASIRQRIQQLELRYHRPLGSVGLLGVSKKQPLAQIRAAVAAGLTDLGENYLQEAEAKLAALADLNCVWHFIGPLQSNKTRAVAEHFAWVQSVDREKIASRLSDQRPADLPPLQTCIQVNISGEANKSGVDPAHCLALAEHVAGLPRLRLRGLMAIPAATDQPAAQRDSFRRLADLYGEIAARIEGVDTLSMGMSGDFEAAIAEGSTLIRLGTALFGPRS